MIRKSIGKVIDVIFEMGLGQIINRLKIGYHNYNLKKLRKELKNVGENLKINTPFVVINPQYISIGNNFSALFNVRLEAIDFFENIHYKPELIIGNNVIFNSDIHIGCINKLKIGDNVLLASRIYISDHSHGNVTIEELSLPPSKRQLTSKGPVEIGNNVWIGEGVCILPGVCIGEDSVIGANSVVTKSIPPKSVAAGIPAKVIRKIE